MLRIFLFVFYIPVLEASEIHHMARSGNMKKLSLLLGESELKRHLKNWLRRELRGRELRGRGLKRGEAKGLEVCLQEIEQLDRSMNKGARRESKEEIKRKVNEPDEHSWTPLHWAAFSGNEEAVALLLEKGAYIHAKTEDHWTPLHVAAFKGKKNVASFLLQKGAKVSARDRRGETPLHLAAFYGGSFREDGLLSLFIAKGADVNSRDKNRWTPLHWAAAMGREQAVHFLVKKGVRKRAKNNKGKTPRDLAMEREYFRIGNFLSL